MAKYSKTEASYRPAMGAAKRRCSNCINYQEAESGCTMVEGSINANFVCNLWKLKPQAQSEDSGLAAKYSAASQCCSRFASPRPL